MFILWSWGNREEVLGLIRSGWDKDDDHDSKGFVWVLLICLFYGMADC